MTTEQKPTERQLDCYAKNGIDLEIDVDDCLKCPFLDNCERFD